MDRDKTFFILVLALSSSVVYADDKKPSKSKDLRFWLENAVVHHGFSLKEAADAVGESEDVVRAAAKRFELSSIKSTLRDGERLKILAYPGGRHPRIGFLDGAVDPHRDTKFSVFAPWRGGGYFVVDLPEAIWFQPGGKRELLYLAHTHIPTHWDKKKVELDRLDWTREKDGVLRSERKFPNGAAFRVLVTPKKDRVDFEMTLVNTTGQVMRGLRTQICVMLKGAPHFDQQNNDNKRLFDDAIAAKADSEDRWVVTIWQRAKPWANERCPCVHSDPTFPDLKPGMRSTLKGRFFFHQGKGLDETIEKHRKNLGRAPDPVPEKR